MGKIAKTSMAVFRNLDCLSLVICSNTTRLKLQTGLVLFLSQIGGATYLQMQLIHGRLRYRFMMVFIDIVVGIDFFSVSQAVNKEAYR